MASLTTDILILCFIYIYCFGDLHWWHEKFVLFIGFPIVASLVFPWSGLAYFWSLGPRTWTVEDAVVFSLFHGTITGVIAYASNIFVYGSSINLSTYCAVFSVILLSPYVCALCILPSEDFQISARSSWSNAITLDTIRSNAQYSRIKPAFTVGDITNMECQAIVNASNEQLQLTTQGISGSIRRIGGQKIQRKMDKVRPLIGGKLSLGQAISTSAGGLPTPIERIIHTRGPKWGIEANCESTLKTSVISCLKEASKHKLESLAIPAISCGVFNGDAEVCVPIIVDTVKDFFVYNPETPLQKIIFVEKNDSQVISVFRNCLGYNTKEKKPEPIVPTVKHGCITSAVCDVIVNSTLNFDMKGSQVGQVLVKKGGQSIADECAKDNRPIRITGAGTLPYKNIFHLNVPRDIDKLGSVLWDLLSLADQRGVRSLAMPPVGTGRIGLRERDVANCIKRVINEFNLIEPISLRTFEVYVFEPDMVVTFQYILKPPNEVIPIEWVDMESKAWKKFILYPRSREYKEVLSLFEKTLKIKVETIERIQNLTLYKQFHAQKLKVEKKMSSTSGVPVTRQLFHGTIAQSCDSICKENFDRGHSGINGTRYGKGVYFATTAKYSNGYAKGNPKHMFLAEVITGEYCQGKPSMNVIPMQLNGLPYDSVVDNMANPSMFVVFRDPCVYPAYLVKYNDMPPDIPSKPQNIPPKKPVNSPSNQQPSKCSIL